MSASSTTCRGRLDDLYDRDAGFQEALEETQAKIAAADKRRVGERKLLDELDRIPELLEEADEQTRFDIVHEAVSEVRILADRNPRKERVVQSVTFKCPVRFFWEEVPGVADGYTAVTPDSFDVDGNSEMTRHTSRRSRWWSASRASLKGATDERLRYSSVVER